jgi:hypothetical protein
MYDTCTLPPTGRMRAFLVWSGRRRVLLRATGSGVRVRCAAKPGNLQYASAPYSLPYCTALASPPLHPQRTGAAASTAPSRRWWPTTPPARGSASRASRPSATRGTATTAWRWVGAAERPSLVGWGGRGRLFPACGVLSRALPGSGMQECGPQGGFAP